MSAHKVKITYNQSYFSKIPEASCKIQYIQFCVHCLVSGSLTEPALPLEMKQMAISLHEPQKNELAFTDPLYDQEIKK